MPLPIWALMGFASYRAWKAAKIVKQAVKVSKVAKRKPAATPKGKSAGTKDYVSAKDRISPYKDKLTKAEEKGADKLLKNAGKAQKQAGRKAKGRLIKEGIRQTVTHPGVQAGSATVGVAAEGRRRAKARSKKNGK